MYFDRFTMQLKLEKKNFFLSFVNLIMTNKPCKKTSMPAQNCKENILINNVFTHVLQ